MLCGGGTREDNAGNIGYYLVLKAERSALKEAWCLLNISAGSRDWVSEAQSRRLPRVRAS